MTQPIDFPLPPDLPRPVDDGAADHLIGLLVPAVALRSTSNQMIDLSQLTAPYTVVYCYPMTGVPGKRLPEGWDLIPGARGCTPQSCGFRDHHREFAALGTEIFGLSTQSTAYQQEMVARLHLPFDVLSDEHFELTNSLRLPSFEVEGMRLLKRLTLIIRNHRIEHVFYPVFPPDQSSEEALRWVKERTGSLAP